MPPTPPTHNKLWPTRQWFWEPPELVFLDRGVGAGVEQGGLGAQMPGSFPGSGAVGTAGLGVGHSIREDGAVRQQVSPHTQQWTALSPCHTPARTPAIARPGGRE